MVAASTPIRPFLIAWRYTVSALWWSATTVKRMGYSAGDDGVIVSVTSKALWYIESHLSGDLSLEAIAEVVGVSRFHLSRAFGVTVGCALASYVRARRLSEAARTLAAGAPDIMSVALDTGYGSHEAFTRAFRQHFRLTPDELREQGPAGALGDLHLMEPIRMNDHTSTTIAPPRIVRGDALLIFGLSQRYHRTNAGIPSQWDRFAPYLGHIDGQIGQVAYRRHLQHRRGWKHRVHLRRSGPRVPRATARVCPLAHLAADLRRLRSPRTRVGNRWHVAGDLESRDFRLSP